MRRWRHLVGPSYLAALAALLLASAVIVSVILGARTAQEALRAREDTANRATRRIDALTTQVGALTDQVTQLRDQLQMAGIQPAVEAPARQVLPPLKTTPTTIRRSTTRPPPPTTAGTQPSPSSTTTTAPAPTTPTTAPPSPPTTTCRIVSAAGICL